MNKEMSSKQIKICCKVKKSEIEKNVDYGISLLGRIGKKVALGFPRGGIKL